MAEMEEREWCLFKVIRLIQDIANGGNGRAEMVRLRSDPSHLGHRKRQRWKSAKPESFKQWNGREEKRKWKSGNGDSSG